MLTLSPKFFYTIVSLENIMTDVNELEKGMEQAKKENDRHRDMRSAEGQAAHAVLRDFLSNSEDKLRKVRLRVELFSVWRWLGIWVFSMH